MTGSASIDAAGNGLDNSMSGNSGANALNGHAGADTMAGGFGDDEYYIDDASDVVTEAADQGVDTALPDITYTLAANVEYLILRGAASIEGRGNTLANKLLGN
jgi:Ca2+-binding RTX toxin-like protein